MSSVRRGKGRKKKKGCLFGVVSICVSARGSVQPTGEAACLVVSICVSARGYVQPTGETGEEYVDRQAREAKENRKKRKQKNRGPSTWNNGGGRGTSLIAPRFCPVRLRTSDVHVPVQIGSGSLCPTRVEYPSRWIHEALKRAGEECGCVACWGDWRCWF